MTTREVHWTVGDQDLTVRIEESKDQGTFTIAGQSIPFRILDSSHIEIAGRRHRYHVLRNRDLYTVWLDGHTYYLQRAGKGGIAHATSAATTGEIRAVMPGKLLRLEVAVGDTVTEKQTVATMESMKMESALRAPKSGRISEIRRQPGEVVEMGEILMVVE